MESAQSQKNAHPISSKNFTSVAGTPFGQNLVVPARFPTVRMARNRSIVATEKAPIVTDGVDVSEGSPSRREILV